MNMTERALESNEGMGLETGVATTEQTSMQTPDQGAVQPVLTPARAALLGCFPAIDGQPKPAKF